MKLDMFTLYDSQTNQWDAPITSMNQHDFIRNITLMMDNKDSRYFRYREDLSVYHTATFDSDTGVVEGLQEPVRICYLKELVKPEEPFNKKKFIEELKDVLGIK